jgi:hypothetical protein
MTARVPAWIDGVQLTGQDMRLAQGALCTPSSAGPATVRSGVRPGPDLLVSANGTPNMTVNVAAGQCLVQGTESGFEGGIVGTNDGVVNLAIAAADATNPRRDLIVARWYSETVIVGSRRFSLEVVTGSPGASPSDPATPANSTVLARVAVAAATSSITAGAVTDIRSFTTALGGCLPCLSTGRPAAPYAGQSIFETDTKLFRVYDGTAWGAVIPSQTTQSGTAAYSIAGVAAVTVTVNFPLTFTAAPTVVAVASTTSLNRAYVYVSGNPTGSTATLRVQQGENSAAFTFSGNVHWTATGPL